MAGRAGTAASRAAAAATAAAQGGEQGAAAPTAREVELERQLAEVRAQLEQSQAAGADPSVEAPVMASVAAAMTEVVTTLRGMQEESARREEEATRRESGTFDRFETPGQVERTLRGSVTRGEHSGRRTPRPVTFRSRGVNFNVVRTARDRFIGRGGEATVTPGVHYDFSPQGEFVTDDADVVEYLQDRPGFNLEFWEVGKEPGQAPSAEPVIDAIMDARMNLDVDALDSIEHAERAEGGYGRQEVFVALESARKSIKAAEQRAGASA